MRAAILALLLAVSACSHPHPLPSCRGTYQQANPGEWTPGADDLTGKTTR